MIRRSFSRRILLVLLQTGEVYLVDLRKEHRGRFELVDPEDSVNEAQGNKGRWVESRDYISRHTEPIYLFLFSTFITTARFEPSGKHIFIGTTQGTILVFNTRTQAVRLYNVPDELIFIDPIKKLVGRHRISGAGVIKGLGFAKSGRYAIHT